MTRLHIHISVDDLDPSIRFYSALFDQDPSVTKADYAKWEVADPSVNLSISRRDGRVAGINHLGVQAETDDELAELHTRLRSADVATADEVGANCCYARSDKHWAEDPQGVIWEMFHTLSGSTTYGDDHAPDPHAATPASPPEAEIQASCC